ncbi:hypothetical protein [Nitratifractor sp.]|nr:hypothetical protein [Nitratifractor sp.]
MKDRVSKAYLSGITGFRPCCVIASGRSDGYTCESMPCLDKNW